MSNQFISSVRIERVSDPSEIPALASVFDTAILASGDNFRELLKRYVEDPCTEVEKRLGAALSPAAEGSPEQHFVLKAVKTVPRSFPGNDNKRGEENPDGASREMPTKEIIVGMAHWTIGYLNIPKVDPFERQSASAPASVVGDESAAKSRLEETIVTGVETANAPEHEPSFDFYAVCRKPVRNTYISQIRGKKHVYLHRIAVHPDHQRCGIARQLLQWGLDRADSEKLVSYLNGRPHARRLYENAGFMAVDIVSMPVPGLEVSDMIVMIRQPHPVKNS